ncbi:MAG TPA: nucleotidyl transferase AbiEii/AbiGii toxin family protein [Candidatus Dormibacteraeota bacterium]|nr:nucleotidyl transferase AbiEii/AbiGii toxin family protein [Candidatus Dormibacteraeota bacterium]
MDPNRLRRHVAFERLLLRLAADVSNGGPRWVLKGGLALELRLGLRARATLDLDLALLEPADDGTWTHSQLVEALACDVQRDWFTFAIQAPRSLVADRSGRPGWRFPVDARLAGRTFAALRLDVVARAEEMAGGTEAFTFPSRLAFASYPPEVTVQAAALTQQAAEKLHALSRPYDDRPNTRTKDLVDLALLIEHDLIDPAGLRERVWAVFAVRATHELPDDLPSVPAAWRHDYAALVAGLDVEATTMDAALERVRQLWRTSVVGDA